VELIVVIAILAILAGVAIPVYSGYVKKAEKAGDEQLLAAVNKAFTAAVSAAGDIICAIASAVMESLSNAFFSADAIS
jgi:type II secretory pathway pseudopilin PulG